MTDYTLADTIYMMFTTRSFSTGAPTTLAGTPVVSAYENDSAVQITAGITLDVDHDTVTGLNLLTIVATGANGYEAGKDYNLVITTGTVGGVSVVGEVVGTFSIERASVLRPTVAGRTLDVTATGATGIDWANVEGQSTSVDLSATAINLCDTVTTNTDMRGTDSAATAANLATAQADLDIITGADGVNLLSGTQASIDAIEADTNELQTDWVNGGRLDLILDATSTQASVDTIDGIVDAILVDTGTTIPGTLGTIAGYLDTEIAAIKAVTDVIPDAGAMTSIAQETTLGGLVTTVGTAGAGLTDLGGMSTAMKAEVNAEADTALVDYDGPTNAEMEARTPTAAQLAYIVDNANTGLPVTFTTAGGSTTTAVLSLVDGATPSTVDDQYNGRLLTFTDGTLKGVVTDITDYNGTTKIATITAIPVAPTSAHNARLT